MNVYVPKSLYMNVHSRFIHSPQVKIPKCLCTEEWINKIGVVINKDFFRQLKKE